MSSARSASGGSYDSDDIEAVEQIGAEVTTIDDGRQVVVGGSDQADIDGDGRLQPTRVSSPYSTTRSRRSCGGRQGGDFIKEQRAAIGILEAAGPCPRGAGEGAGFIAEEFGVDQVFGQRRAVERDQRPGGAAAALVQQLCNDILARARGPGDQHRGRGIGDGFNLGPDGLDRRAVADEAGQLGRLPGSKGR